MTDRTPCRTPEAYQARLQALLARRGIHVAPRNMGDSTGLVGGLSPGLILSVDFYIDATVAQILTTDPADFPLESVDYLEGARPSQVAANIYQVCRRYMPPKRKAKP
jgi:hypothetical protein